MHFLVGSKAMDQEFCGALDLLNAQVFANFYLANGISSYASEFFAPLGSAAGNFTRLEASRLFFRDPLANMLAYHGLFSLVIDLVERHQSGLQQTLQRFADHQWQAIFAAMRARENGYGNELAFISARNLAGLRQMTVEYPAAIKAIEPHYGFHFERQPESLVMETDRFSLHQVLPAKDGITVNNALKPVLILPPFVLGANILAFLPEEDKSYAHAFANRGIPTYIRILKPIAKNTAVQLMTAEEDACDTAIFCKKIKEIHSWHVTLNGYCQGGYSAICNILSGKLDGLVDALITCVTPVDGSCSYGLGKFLKDLPEEFNDLAYGTKTLANGNKVADGRLMGWVYKLKSIEDSGPLSIFFQDYMMFAAKNGGAAAIGKTVAALNYWLRYERSDLPLAITEMSFKAYNNPIAEDGTLPVSLFGKKLNLREMGAKKINWLLCYGENDDLVEKEVALAALQYTKVEVSPFPKGHVAIATSWSNPASSCALDKVFGEQKSRGPVRFQLDLAKEPRQ